MFIITAKRGRGLGKSSLLKMLSHYVGGHLDVTQAEDPVKLKSRMLSPEGATKRVVGIDNVKSLRFSWAELEGLVTASRITGWKAYIGEQSRPNLLTYVLTLNGPSLCTDMAQRACIIRLDQPKRIGTWEEDTIGYIDEHRESITADLVAFLRSERSELPSFTRWAAWEKDVLSRLPEPAEAQAVIRERQGEVDIEGEEADQIEDDFRGHLADLHYDSTTDKIFIPSGVACDWLNAVLKEKHSKTKTTRILGQMIDEERINRLSRNTTRDWGRGFIWIGEDWQVDGTTRTDLETRIRERDRQQRMKF